MTPSTPHITCYLLYYERAALDTAVLHNLRVLVLAIQEVQWFPASNKLTHDIRFLVMPMISTF